MAKKTYESLKNEYKKVYSKLKETTDEKEAMSAFLSHLKTSKSEFSQISRTETKKYDLEWIDYLEKAVNALTIITQNPKRNLKQVRSIVPIELAKRTNAESVRHLSQHSQYVKDVDKQGNVIPGKILTVDAEDDYAIYENRFIKTLIDKLIIFCRKRYEYMKDHLETHDTDILVSKSKVVIDGVTFEYESKIKISQPSNDEGKREYNEELFKKITMLVERINFFKTTAFYNHVKDTRPVRSPIIQTNIMLKNQHYKTCYEVWKFLDHYDQLGISIKVKELEGKFDEEYLNRLYEMVMMSTLTLNVDRYHKVKVSPSRKKQVQPKLNKKIIDPSLDNTKFDLALTYGRDQLTKAQLEAIKKKEEAEKARLKRLAQREKEKEKRRLQKEKEKEKRRLALAKQKEREKAKRLKALEKEKERLRIQKEKEAERLRLKALKEAERQRLLDEQEKLRRTRITVKRIAENNDHTHGDADVVTEEMIRKDKDFLVKNRVRKIIDKDTFEEKEIILEEEFRSLETKDSNEE